MVGINVYTFIYKFKKLYFELGRCYYVVDYRRRNGEEWARPVGKLPLNYSKTTLVWYL